MEAVNEAAQILSVEQIATNGSLEGLEVEEWGRRLRGSSEEAQRLYLTKEKFAREFGGATAVRVP